MEKNKKLILVFMLLLSLVLSFFILGCQADEAAETDGSEEAETDGSEEAAAETGEPINLGFVYSLSGPFSPVGNIEKNAVTLAIDLVNEDGGLEINGQKHLIEAVFRDDESKPDVAARRMRELAEEGIEVINGGSAVHLGSAMAEASKASGSFFMASCGTETTMFHKDTKAPYSLSAIGNTISVGRAGTSYVIEEYNPKKIVYFLPDYAFGHMHEAGSKQILEQHPDIEYHIVYSPVDTKDMTPYIIQVRDLDPDIVVMGHWGADAITAIKQVHEMGLKDETDIFFLWMISVFAKAIEPEALEGIKLQTFWHHDMTGFADQEIVDTTDGLVQSWIDRIGEPPDALGVAAWIGIQETFRGIQLAGSTDPASVYNALMENPDFISAKGPATWRIDGTPDYEYWSFVLEGKGPSEREDMVWDFGKVADALSGSDYIVTLNFHGWE